MADYSLSGGGSYGLQAPSYSYSDFSAAPVDYSLVDYSLSGASSDESYSPSSGIGGSYGLQAPAQTGIDYGFNASPGLGLQPPADFGGRLGTTLGDGMSAIPGFFAPPNYSLQSQSQLASIGSNQYGFQPQGASGFNVSPASVSQGYTLAAPSAPPGLTGTRQDPGFFGTQKGKVVQMLLGLIPGGNIFNAGINMMQGQNPLQAMLGLVPGVGGQIASIAYGASQAKDPAAYLGQAGAMNLLGTVGGSIGGPALATAATGLLGSQFAKDQANAYSPFGSGESVLSDRGDTRGTMGGGGGTQVAGGEGGGDWLTNTFGNDWAKNLMGIGSGLYGMYKQNQMGKTAQQAIAGSAPWTASGGTQVAGDALKKIIAGDFTGDAGYKAAQQSAARASAQQPGGFAASAAAQAALRYQNERIQALGGAAGVGFNPAAGYQTSLAGQQQAANLASQSLASIGYGATGSDAGTQMPPWLQSYLIQQGMQRG